MKVIRNTKLFNELKNLYKEGKNVWQGLFDYEGHLKDPEIPYLAGGLDHIEIKKKGIYFYDIGCNERNNSFVIRPEVKSNSSWISSETIDVKKNNLDEIIETHRITTLAMKKNIYANYLITYSKKVITIKVSIFNADKMISKCWIKKHIIKDKSKKFKW